MICEIWFFENSKKSQSWKQWKDSKDSEKTINCQKTGKNQFLPLGYKLSASENKWKNMDGFPEDYQEWWMGQCHISSLPTVIKVMKRRRFFSFYSTYLMQKKREIMHHIFIRDFHLQGLIFHSWMTDPVLYIALIKIHIGFLASAVRVKSFIIWTLKAKLWGLYFWSIILYQHIMNLYWKQLHYKLST